MICSDMICSDMIWLRGGLTTPSKDRLSPGDGRGGRRASRFCAGWCGMRGIHLHREERTYPTSGEAGFEDGAVIRRPSSMSVLWLAFSVLWARLDRGALGYVRSNWSLRTEFPRIDFSCGIRVRGPKSRRDFGRDRTFVRRPCTRLANALRRLCRGALLILVVGRLIGAETSGFSTIALQSRRGRTNSDEFAGGYR